MNVIVNGFTESKLKFRRINPLATKNGHIAAIAAIAALRRCRMGGFATTDGDPRTPQQGLDGARNRYRGPLVH